MRYAPMRFCGISLSHNPQTLTVSDSAGIRELAYPCSEPDSESLGLKLKKISGEGEFCGDDRREQYAALERLLKMSVPGKLILPVGRPMYAYLKELSLTAPPINGVLRYKFTFIQAQSPRKDVNGVEYYVTESQGESLWDICYAFNADISETVMLNPQIKFIDDLKKGERVRLC